jgi:hypothetical protein
MMNRPTMPRICPLLTSLTLLATNAFAADPAALPHANADHPAVAQQRLAAHPRPPATPTARTLP